MSIERVYSTEFNNFFELYDWLSKGKLIWIDGKLFRPDKSGFYMHHSNRHEPVVTYDGTVSGALKSMPIFLPLPLDRRYQEYSKGE